MAWVVEMSDWREEQDITIELGLRQCSMNRCCNAVLIKEQQKKIQSLVEKNAKLVEQLPRAYSAGFFDSHCSHNGEMVDDMDLKNEGKNRLEYTKDMFDEWVLKEIENEKR